jgi:hexulose-6-phosphate isomerase
MKVGVTALMLPREWSFKEMLKNVTADGYDALELILHEDGWFSLQSSERELKDLARQAQDAGVELVSVCPVTCGLPFDMMTNDASVREASINTAVECMRVSAGAGIGTVLWILGSLTPELYYDEAYENALGAMHKVAPVAEDMGVKLAIEYVWNKFLLSPMEFAWFCDEVDSPNVGYYFDAGNMVIQAYPEHWVRICGRRLMAVHFKDFKREGYEWVALGEGDVNFPAVMAELRKIGFDGALVSEVEPHIASYADTARAIKKIMAG